MTGLAGDIGVAPPVLVSPAGSGHPALTHLTAGSVARGDDTQRPRGGAYMAKPGPGLVVEPNPTRTCGRASNGVMHRLTDDPGRQRHVAGGDPPVARALSPRS